MGATPYRYPPSNSSPATMPEHARAIVLQARRLIEAMDEGGEAGIVEEALELMHSAEEVCRMYPEDVVEKGYLFVVEKHAGRGDYDGGSRR